MMSDNDDDPRKQLRRFEHCDPMPTSSADYDKEFPLTDEPHTCSKCGRTYTKEAFLALPIPKDGGLWTYPDSPVQLAIRHCTTSGCNNSLARRSA